MFITGESFQESLQDLRREVRVLLVDSDYKYPPLGLCRLSSWLKSEKRAVVRWVRGRMELEADYSPWMICFAVNFSWDFVEFAKNLGFFVDRYPEALFVVGGPAVTLMREPLKKLISTVLRFCFIDILLVDGLVPCLENIKPDYSNYPNNPYDFVYTTRGCSRGCSFCYVPKIEGPGRILEGWENQLTDKNIILFHDNNILLFEDHFFSVCERIRHRNLNERANKHLNPIFGCFDNGLDCREFTLKHALALQLSMRTYRHCLRFSYDSPNQKDSIAETSRIIEEVWGRVSRKNLSLVYFLVGYKEKPEEAFQRKKFLEHLDLTPCAQKYCPLEFTGSVWHDHLWNQEKLDEFVFETNYHLSQQEIMP